MSEPTTEKPQRDQLLGLQAEEERALSPDDRKGLLDWLETEYYLSPKVHGLANQWSRRYGPFWLDIIAALDDTTTREIWVYAPAQAGKSTIMTGWLGHTIDCDPVPMGLVMPRDTDAAERVETNIVPMFEQNPRLLDHAGGKVRNINIGKMTMFDNMAFYLLFATSAAAMASKAICRIGLDETGKFPAFVGRESDPISLARDRLETFKGRSKLYAVTTPVVKGDLTDQQWVRGDRCEYRIRCAHCDRLHRPAWSCVILDKTPDGKLLDPDLYAKGGRARYVCPDCGTVLTEADRWSSVLSGRWIPDGLDPDDFDELPPRSIRSFRITALILHPALQTIDYLASRWAAAMSEKRIGNTKPLQGFINSRLAEPWEQKEAEPDEARLAGHVGGYRAGIVPAGGRILTAAIDVQLDHLWLMVVAWGWQFEGWVVDARRIETGDTEQIANFEAARPFLQKRWDMESDPDVVLRLALAGMDANYRTDQVYSICRNWPEVPLVPVMGFGTDKISGRLYRTVKLADGLIRYDLNADHFKSAIYRQLFVAESPGPGFLHLFEGMPAEFLRHFVSEHQVVDIRRGRSVLTWILRDSHWPNHLWDLLVYNRMLAELAGVSAITNPTARPVGPRYPGRPAKRKPIRTKY